MNPEAILVWLSLIKQAASAMRAMEGVAEVVKNKVERGEEITIDDIKQYSLADDSARDALVKAIEEAEAQ